jgi:hypothetical protein
MMYPILVIHRNILSFNLTEQNKCSKIVFVVRWISGVSRCHLCFANRANFARFMANIATAIANFAQRCLSPVLSPHFRPLGGASPVSRRFLWRKIRQSVALPLLSASPFGGNMAKLAN